MGNRIPLFVIIAVIAGFAILILLNVVNTALPSRAKYLSPRDVRGMAVVHKNLIYTLNFEQQNTLVDIFNRAFPISRAQADSLSKKTTAANEIQKIIIYLFNAPEIEIKPIGYISNKYSKEGEPPAEHVNLIFSAPAWNAEGLMEEAPQDQMRDLLANTYDP